MIGHRMDSGDNIAGKLHCALIGVIPLSRVHILTILVGGRNTYILEIDVFEIEFILNFIF